MPDQSLAQLLKEARDFSDYQKVEARIHEQFISRDEAMGALLRLAERVEALESGQPEAATPEDPRPPTRPGDEFPTVGAERADDRGVTLERIDRVAVNCSFCGARRETDGGSDGRFIMLNPAKTATICERCTALFAGYIKRRSPAPTLNPPSKAVRVDSLPVGARCLIEATVTRAVAGYKDVRVSVGERDGLWLPPDTLVLPAEPSAKEYNGGMATLLPWEIEARRIHAAEKPLAEPNGAAPIREVTIPRNDTGNSGSRTSPPTPIQLRVGHRYKRADGGEAECIRDNRNDIRCDTGNAFTCRDKSGLHLGYFANGRRWATISDKRDLIEDLGPVAERSEGVKPRPAWATREMIELLQSGEWGIKAWVRRPTLQGPADSYYAMRAAVEAKMGDELSCEAAREALLAELGVKP